MALPARAQPTIALQGADPREDVLLNSDVVTFGGLVTNKGENQTEEIVLGPAGDLAYHKPFAGVKISTTGLFGHQPDEPPIHECVAWHLARVLGAPYDSLVPTAVIRAINGEWGSLTARAEGVSGSTAPFLHATDQAETAAFWDCLVGQQDRHRGNMRWDAPASKLRLIDHGYAFAAPSDHFNHSVFLDWRWRNRDRHLSPAESTALLSLQASADLLGVAPLLATNRVNAIRSRIDRMLASGEILAPGDF